MLVLVTSGVSFPVITTKQLKLFCGVVFFSLLQIGVPNGSKQYFQEELRGAKLIEMNSLKDLRNHLAIEHRKRRVVYYSCMSESKGADRDKQIVRALKHHLIGTEMKVKHACLSHADVTVHSLVKCVRKEIGKFIENCDPFITEKANDLEENCNIKMDHYGEINDFEIDDPTAIIIYASVGLVAVMLFAGSVWDLTRPHDQREKEEGTGRTSKTSGGSFMLTHGGSFVFTHGTARAGGESHVKVGFETAEDPIEICEARGEENNGR